MTTISKKGYAGLKRAIEIFEKYGDTAYPFHCEHDTLMVYSVHPDKVSSEDKAELDELGFFVSGDTGELHFRSYAYGSC